MTPRRAARAPAAWTTDPLRLVGVVVPVMQIGVVSVTVDHAAMLVAVGVRLAGRIVGGMDVLMVRVVQVGVFVLQRLMDVLVLVSLDEVQV